MSRTPERPHPPERPEFKVGYWICLQAARLSSTLLCRVRFFGAEQYHRVDGGLVCANHQSHLDPVLVSTCCPRPMSFLARKSLFQTPGLGALIRHLNTIPVDREGMGIGGVKEAIRRTRAGELMLVFPEGTRSPSGQLQPFLPGLCAVARRSRVPLIPVGVDGAYQVWPRHRALPRPGLVVVQIGEPIAAETYQGKSDEELLQTLRGRIEDAIREARRRRMHLLK